jgi:hypothetical protein
VRVWQVDLMAAEDSLLGEEALGVKRADVVAFSRGISDATTRFDRFRALIPVL